MASKKPDRALTPKQRAFVDEYLVDLNGTQAAIRAGYAAGSAAVQASRLLTNANILAAVRIGIEERSKSTKITAESVLSRLDALADKCADEEHWAPSASAKALELLGKHLALFTDKLRHEHGEHGGGVLLVPEEKTAEEWIEEGESMKREKEQEEEKAS